VYQRGRAVTGNAIGASQGRRLVREKKKARFDVRGMERGNIIGSIEGRDMQFVQQHLRREAVDWGAGLFIWPRPKGGPWQKKDRVTGTSCEIRAREEERIRTRWGRASEETYYSGDVRA